jgi:hypothetical protein
MENNSSLIVPFRFTQINLMHQAIRKIVIARTPDIDSISKLLIEIQEEFHQGKSLNKPYGKKL